MCIAIYIPAYETISKDRLYEAYSANPDGVGILFSKHKRLNYVKGLLSFDEFYEFYGFYSDIKTTKKSDIILHFRTASASAIGVEYCHPHFVNENLAFVHNGNFFDFSNMHPDNIDSQSDTQRFNEQILKKLPSNFLWKPNIVIALEKYCKSTMSKMIFMNHLGYVFLINEEAGEWKDGIYYSNSGIENYIGYGYSGAYYYKPGDIRHKGGLLSVQLFGEETRERWWKCKQCQGWFHISKDRKDDICSDCQILNNLRQYCDV